MYKAYKCLICESVFMVCTEDKKRMEAKGRYIACTFGHRQIKELGSYDNIIECMQQHSYSRENGRMKQKR